MKNILKFFIFRQQIRILTDLPPETVFQCIKKIERTKQNIEGSVSINRFNVDFTSSDSLALKAISTPLPFLNVKGSITVENNRTVLMIKMKIIDFAFWMFTAGYASIFAGWCTSDDIPTFVLIISFFSSMVFFLFVLSFPQVLAANTSEK